MKAITILIFWIVTISNLTGQEDKYVYFNKLIGKPFTYYINPENFIVKYKENVSISDIRFFESTNNITKQLKIRRGTENSNSYIYSNPNFISNSINRNSTLIEEQIPFLIDEYGNEFGVLPKEFLICFNNYITYEKATSILNNYGCKITKKYHSLNLYKIQVNSNESTFNIIEILNDLEDVKYVEPIFIINIRPNCDGSNDPLIHDQWYLERIGICDVWNLLNVYGSSEVVITVIDDGVQIEHQDLTNNIFRNLTEVNGIIGVDDDNNDYIDDYNGWNVFDNNGNVAPSMNPQPPPILQSHGTRTSGIISAGNNNNIGVSGIAPMCKILPIKFYDANESNSSFDGISEFYTDKLVDAIDYVITMREKTGKRFIINLSYGWVNTIQPPSIIDIINLAVEQPNMIPIFCSAGNYSNSQVFFPANLNSTISVARTRPNDTWGPNCKGIENDFGAPGEDIYTTDINDGYTLFSGTSASSPIAAAVAALLLSIKNDLTPEEIRVILQNSADKIDNVNYNWNPQKPGHSVELGYGRINAFKAINYFLIQMQFNNDVEGVNMGHLKVNNQIVNSGYTEIFSTGLTVQTEIISNTYNNGFYDTKFYSWNIEDVNGQTRNTLHNFIVDPYENELISLYKKTKPLTVRNYFEGGNGGNITFGEKNFDVSNKTSPYNENAFLFQPQTVEATYQAVAQPNFTSLFGSNWNFVKWENGSTNLTREEQINQNTSSDWRAFFKAQLKSDNTLGISSNSQRKITRTDDGIYHIVYESLGDVWYTRSTTTNFYGAYTQDLSLTDNQWQAANPSIDSYGNTVVVTFEYNNYGTTGIAYLENQSSVFPNVFPTEIATIQNSYYGSAKPVVAITPFERFVCYRTSGTTGLKYKKYYTGWSSEYTITGTDANSINPSIAGKKVISNNKQEVHIAYQQSTTEIKYVYVYQHGNGGGVWIVVYPASISGGDGYTTNKLPSISLRKNGTNYDPIVCWTGLRKEEVLNKKLGKETSLVTVNRIITRPKSSSWGSFYVAGDNVSTTNNNSSFSSNDETVFALTTDNGSPSKWLKRTGTTYSTLSNLSHSGSQVQLSNGANLNQLKSFAFNVSSVPYSINKITTVFDNVGKITLENQPTYGRMGVVSKNGIEFVFSLGDLLLDDQNILFTERSDTLPVINLTELNQSTQTNSFTLNSNSNLYFSVFYYVINSEMADSLLTENDTVSFRVELVDALTNQVIGTFDDIIYTKNNLQQYANIDYLVNCSQLTGSTYYFRLVTEVQNDGLYTLSNIQNDRENLAKKQYREVELNNNTIPLEYSLYQNYPNPFNPTSTIRYDLPDDGFVQLEIFDILGRRITTLVSDEKPAGKYEVNFNASSLASGVYIYKLQAGEFNSSKKMILLK